MVMNMMKMESIQECGFKTKNNYIKKQKKPIKVCYYKKTKKRKDSDTNGKKSKRKQSTGNP